MALAANQIVDAIATVLRTLPGMADRVFTSRSHPLSEDVLPCWKVTAGLEPIESTGVNWPARQQHDLEVSCSGYQAALEDLDDRLGDMAAAALKELFKSKAQSVLSPIKAVAMVLVHIEREMEAHGQAVLGRITLLLRVRFFTFNNDPETVS